MSKIDDSTKRYILDVVDHLNITPNKKAALYEHIRTYTEQHRQPGHIFRDPGASLANPQEAIGEL